MNPVEEALSKIPPVRSAIFMVGARILQTTAIDELRIPAHYGLIIRMMLVDSNLRGGVEQATNYGSTLRALFTPEELEPKAGGRSAELCIAELPPGTKYYIHEYDGLEDVRTPDDIDWQIA